MYGGVTVEMLTDRTERGSDPEPRTRKGYEWAQATLRKGLMRAVSRLYDNEDVEVRVDAGGGRTTVIRATLGVPGASVTVASEPSDEAAA